VVCLNRIPNHETYNPITNYSVRDRFLRGRANSGRAEGTHHFESRDESADDGGKPGDNNDYHLRNAERG
jgi:hypothetical protein